MEHLKLERQNTCVRTLLVGAHSEKILPVLRGDVRVMRDEAVELDLIRRSRPDLLISFGHRHVVDPEVIRELNGNAFNVHISLLPWNRGADPNLWSWLQNTPRGVSLHWMSNGIDEGDLVAQRRLDLDPDNSLRSSYEALIVAAVELFAVTWRKFSLTDLPRIKQPIGGTTHRLRDKDQYSGSLTNGWDTQCREVLEYGRARGLWVTEQNAIDL